MKTKIVINFFIVVFISSFELSAQNFGYTSSGRWIKVAKIQHRNPIDSGERAQITGTVYVQTDYGQAARAQYIAHFSFGSRGSIKPLLVEFGNAAGRPANDPSRIEWRIYEDPDGWHYLWFRQSNYSRFADFEYSQIATVEYWSIENPPSGWTKVWSSLDGDRQGMITGGDAIFRNGNVGIGTTSPDQPLTVAGTGKFQEVIVEENTGADFVFADNYDLPSLSKVEKHIKSKKHLPEIPSAQEMITNGVKVGELQMKLLQKIEELTLYAIDQEKVMLDQKRQLILLKENLRAYQIELKQIKESVNKINEVQ